MRSPAYAIAAGLGLGSKSKERTKKGCGWVSPMNRVGMEEGSELCVDLAIGIEGQPGRSAVLSKRSGVPNRYFIEVIRGYVFQQNFTFLVEVTVIFVCNLSGIRFVNYRVIFTYVIGWLYFSTIIYIIG